MSFDFLDNWFKYGVIVAVLGGGITIQLYGKYIGYTNLNWKHYAIIVPIWLFPTVLLPLLLMPGLSLSGKIIMVIGLILFGVLKYYTTTKAQEGMAELRKLKNRDKDNKK